MKPPRDFYTSPGQGHRRTSNLIHLTAARQAIAKAKNVDEIAQIRDKARAVEVYAKARGLSIEVFNDAAEIKVRAEIRAGEIIHNLELKPGKPKSLQAGRIRPRLEDLGITEADSHRWQSMAKVPEKKREEYIATARAHAEEITTSGVLKLAQRATTASNLLRNESVEWYTPSPIIESARAAMGSIDLDPASSEEANEVVKATKFYTAEDDGLKQPWIGNIWINPPYGDVGPDFVGRALVLYERRGIAQAIILISAHGTDTAWFRPLWDHLLCFSYGRLLFRRAGRSTGGATMGSALAYLGPRRAEFAAEFSKHGAIVSRWHA